MFWKLLETVLEIPCSRKKLILLVIVVVVNNFIPLKMSLLLLQKYPFIMINLQ